MSANPWMKFYPQDWRSDEKLRLCSLAARGLWIEMLAIMHRSERYGQLLISGRVPTDAQLAVQAGASPDQVSALMVELEEAGVFSRAASGAIYSRRMTRDARKAETARRNGKKGGNPNLGKHGENSTLDNLEDKLPDKGGVKAQRPEARVSGSKEPAEADPVKTLFDLGVSLLSAGGKSDQSARSLVGMWRKSRGDADVLAAIGEARSKTEPAAWLIKRLAGERSGQGALYVAAGRIGRERKITQLDLEDAA